MVGVQLSVENRTYLVTGGGSGIGKGVAAALVDAGANVMIIGRNADKLAAVVDSIRERLLRADKEGASA